MPDQITITGKIGPGLTVTSLNIQDVRKLEIDTVNSVIRVYHGDGNSPKEFDIGAATTVTVTLASGTFTVTIS